MDIQKGVNHNFSKIVFLVKQIIEVNANTIAQTIFFSNRKYFYFRFRNQKSVSRGVEMGTFLCHRVKFQKCGLRPFECPLFIYSINSNENINFAAWKPLQSGFSIRALPLIRDWAVPPLPCLFRMPQDLFRDFSIRAFGEVWLLTTSSLW